MFSSWFIKLSPAESCSGGEGALAIQAGFGFCRGQESRHVQAEAESANPRFRFQPPYSLDQC